MVRGEEVAYSLQLTRSLTHCFVKECLNCFYKVVLSSVYYLHGWVVCLPLLVAVLVHVGCRQKVLVPAHRFGVGCRLVA